MKDRASKIEEEKANYAMLENKISKLAFKVVESVLHEEGEQSYYKLSYS